MPEKRVRARVTGGRRPSAVRLWTKPLADTTTWPRMRRMIGGGPHRAGDERLPRARALTGDDSGAQAVGVGTAPDLDRDDGRPRDAPGWSGEPTWPDERRATDPPSHYLVWSRTGRSSAGRYASGLLLIVLAWAAGSALVPMGFALRGMPASPAGLLATLTGSFVLGWVALPLIVRLVLRRPAWSVIAGWWRGPVRHWAWGAAIVAGASVATDLLGSAVVPLRVGEFHPSAWLPLAAVAVVGFFVQAGFEELLVRGYLMQAVASRTMRAGVVVGGPAAVFASLHWGNLAPFDGTPLQVVPYLLMGLTWGWAAWFSGSLWLPFGMHWANNVCANLAVTSAGDVLPTGAPLVRDLATMPLDLFILLTAVHCAIQVIAVRLLVPRARLPEDSNGWHSCAPSARRC